MKALTILGQPGCHLCDEMFEELCALLAGRARIHLVDINEDEELLRRYCLDIPVLMHENKEICRHKLDPVKLEKYLESTVS